MGSASVVRTGRAEDAAAMARVHVAGWRETYRGLMCDEVLDDPGFVATRERFWTAALTDSRFAHNRITVAEVDGTIIGIAMSGPPMDGDATRQLYVLYVLAAHHGSGAGPELLHAVVDRQETTSLWVADPNPRAQAFYRRHGFGPDGEERVEDGLRELRLLRPADPVPADPVPADPAPSDPELTP